MMAKPKEQAGLRLVVHGTKLELSALFKAAGGARGGNLAKSSAGTSGFKASRYCPEHVCPVKQRNVCEKHGHDVDLKTVLSGYDMGGGKMAYLTKEEEAALKPKGDDTIEVLYLIDASTYGSGFVPDLARLRKNVQALVPNLTLANKKAQATLWAALLALLQGKVGVARVVDGGSFFHALLVPSPTGCILAYETHLPEDAYEVPVIEVPDLTETQLSAYFAKSDELTRPLDVADISQDPFRDAKFEAILAASRGEAPKQQPPAVVVQKEVDLLALI